MPNLKVYESPDKFSEAVLTIKDKDIEIPLVCRLGGGILRFVDAVFPKQSRSALYANSFDRDEDIGPHFDVYDDYLLPEAPWVGVYNLAGVATVQTTPLPPQLMDIYKEMHTERTDAASQARRHLGGLALGNPHITSDTFMLRPGVGMVLPQRPGGLGLIHEVVAEKTSGAGKYIKIVAPDMHTPTTLRTLEDEFGYQPFEQLLSEALGETTSREEPAQALQQFFEDMRIEPRSIRRPPRSRSRRIRDSTRKLD